MQSNRLNRREFIALVGGVAAAWPLAARAQQPERVRRIGVLMNIASDDAEGQARSAFHQLGWTVGHNAGSTIAGAAPTPNAFAKARQN